MAKRNHFSSVTEGWLGGVQITPASNSRLFGPCTARLASWSVEDLTKTLRPQSSALRRNQTPVKSSPATTLKLLGPSRITVASSSMPPWS